MHLLDMKILLKLINITVSFEIKILIVKLSHQSSLAKLSYDNAQDLLSSIIFFKNNLYLF